VRMLALSCLSYGGYKLQPYPLLHLSKLLMMKESDVESLCTDCALETSSDGTGKGLLPTKQSVITKSAGGLQKYYPLESQRIESLGACFNCLLINAEEPRADLLYILNSIVLLRELSGTPIPRSIDTSIIQAIQFYNICLRVAVMHRATRALVAACIIVFLAPRKGGSLTANSFSYTKTDTLALMETSQALNE
ncbi:UNVERIFIED_CONTAM: hypothetical protein Sradi_2653500, partial [Sesamum radiatum]